MKVSNITVSSPKDSPNTDGIHLQNSKDVEIQHSNIGCGKTTNLNFSIASLIKHRKSCKAGSLMPCTLVFALHA